MDDMASKYPGWQTYRLPTGRTMYLPTVRDNQWLDDTVRHVPGERAYDDATQAWDAAYRHICAARPPRSFFSFVASLFHCVFRGATL